MLRFVLNCEHADANTHAATAATSHLREYILKRSPQTIPARCQVDENLVRTIRC